MEYERQLWSDDAVWRPKGQILTISIFVTVIYAAVHLLFGVLMGNLRFWIATDVGWPTYGALFQLGCGITFAVGGVAHASTSTALLGVFACFVTIVLALDMLSAAAVGMWVFNYYVGLLTVAQAALLPSLFYALIVALFSIVLVVLDCILLMIYIQLISTVNAIREGRH